MSTYIHIPEPCHEDWNNMLPEQQGRYCQQCCKTVIDFTKWETTDIAAYLQANGGNKTCGRFINSQLEIPIEDSPEILVKRIWYTSFSSYQKLAAIVILFFAITSAGCSLFEDGPVTTGSIVIQQFDTVQTKSKASHDTIIAKTKAPKETCTKDTPAVIMGDTILSDTVAMPIDTIKAE